MFINSTYPFENIHTFHLQVKKVSQMLHQISPSYRLQVTFIFIFIFIFSTFPVSFTTGDEYNECSHAFDCGNFRNIRYPFWGHPLPLYCGLPEFHLECIHGFPVIKLMSERFRVLNMDYDNHLLRLVRLDLYNSTCPSMLTNTTLSYLFSYTPNFGNLTLFYGCLSVSSGMAFNQFRCEGNDTLPSEIGYYSIGSVPSGRNIGKCNLSIIVPVLQSAVKAFVDNTTSSLIGVMNKGFEVHWLTDQTACSECLDSGGRCGYNTSYFRPICFCPDQPYEMRCPTSSGSELDIENVILIVASVLGACSIAGILVIICRFRKTLTLNKSIIFWKKKSKHAQNIEAFLEICGSLAPKRYSYSEVKRMTNSFKDKLGEGGYGGVYRGKLPDGREVAVKVLIESNSNGEEFVNEVASISRTAHVNIVTLHGFCFEVPKRALLYEFMPNGSLDKYIYDENQSEEIRKLGYERIYQIAIGIAHGLEYLHRGCNTQILHLDIKPQNILLDQDFCPKISDFGLSRLYNREESSVSMSAARGTAGYIAPEVFSRNFGVISHKADVYSYGMMILEMVSRRKNISPGLDQSSEIYFPHWIYARLKSEEDMKLQRNMDEGDEIARKMTLVGLWCIQTNPENRPSMDRVVDMLEGKHETLQVPPEPFPSSPPE